VHIIFVEPRFPANQKHFVRALAELGVTISAIGEGSKASLDGDLKRWLHHYEEVTNVTSEAQMLAAVRRIQSYAWVDRLEAVVEAHVLTAAKVRDKTGIPGTSARTAWLCRDKPAMKEVLRAGGLRCAMSTGADSGDEVRAFVESCGYPVIVKPRDGAGASGTYRIENAAELEQAIAASGVDEPGRSVAVEEFIEGHEGFYDTLSLRGDVVHDFACHYYPNVLPAMRSRATSPYFVATNRIDGAPAYQEVRAMGQRVIELLGIGTSSTHMEWFSGPKGLIFSEIGCRPPGVRTWDLYNVGNDMDLYREWASFVCFGEVRQIPSRRFATGIVALRPDRDGRIRGAEGWDRFCQQYGDWIIDGHLPHPGTPTQPVSAGYMANAWLRMKHENYDSLRELMDHAGTAIQLRAG